MSEKLAEVIDKLNDDEIRNLISLLFDGYKNRQKENRLYITDDPIPKMIINLYYSCIERPEFDTLMGKYRRKYIENENKSELVHTKEEQEGLKVVYEYIHTHIDINNLNIFILLKLHQLLYSKAPYPELAGSFRKRTVFLPGSGMDLTSYDLIPKEMSLLYSDVNTLIKKGIEIGKTYDSKELISYIDSCVDLHCKLVKIHPFEDGNGRTIRAFINILFKLVNIPPVYIKLSEKEEYNKGISKYCCENNPNDIRTFFYYKICDSIIDLDIEYKEDIKLHKRVREIDK